MNRSAKLIQNLTAVNSLKDKKWEAVAADYVALWAEGYTEERIMEMLSDKYFLEPITIKNRLRLRNLRRQGNDAMRAKLRALKNGTYIETQTQPMNGVEYR